MEEKTPLYTRKLLDLIRHETGHDLTRHGFLRGMIIVLQALCWDIIYLSVDELREHVKLETENKKKEERKKDVFAQVRLFMPRLVLMLEEGREKWRSVLLPFLLCCSLCGVVTGFVLTMLYFAFGG